jgi:hypothetical protein
MRLEPLSVIRVRVGVVTVLDQRDASRLKERKLKT